MANEKKALAVLSTKLNLCGQLSPELSAWVGKCPAPKEMQQVLAYYVWLEEKVECFECGDEHQRKDLQWDLHGPFATGDTLICKDCWEMYCPGGYMYHKGTEGAPAWPKTPPVMEPTSIVTNGMIRDKESGKWVGEVSHYNRQHHTGRVSLYNFPASSDELGSLDPGWEVVDNDDD